MTSGFRKQENVVYISADSKSAAKEAADAVFSYIERKWKDYEELVILCIGSDRATGDCFGPIVGENLQELNDTLQNVKIYGSLKSPVHAKNISSVAERIRNETKKPLVVAVDAALGKSDRYVGHLMIGEGSVRPGASVNRALPKVGEIFVTGIVNTVGRGNEMHIIAHTRLNTVMKMAKIAIEGLKDGIGRAAADKDNKGQIS